MQPAWRWILRSAVGRNITVGDLLLWDQALYTETLLSRESLQTVFTPNPGPYPPGWLFSNEGGGYGYGWVIDELFGRKLYHHSGLIYGSLP